MAPPPAPAAAAAKRVYTFNKQTGSDGTKDMKELLGGKGANLCEMARIGLNVPPGFTITTEECFATVQAGGKIQDDLWSEVLAALAATEAAAGKKYGAAVADPLLLSVRSGAALSMPGMMDTVLNMGLNDAVVAAMEAGAAGDPARLRWARDCHRRFIDMYGNVVLGIPHDAFEAEIAGVKEARGVKLDVELSAADLSEVVARYKGVVSKAGLSIPDAPLDQLRAAIGAVFNSWNTPRAIAYRRINRITGLKGTACNIQCMVSGNADGNSGSGVVFTRSPSDGTPAPYGEFLVNAQGEDVVSGGRTPQDISSMAASFPGAHADLLASLARLEDHYADMMDCEFTVQSGQLFMLQTRAGKRTGAAALRIALDMEREGRVSKADALLMVEPKHLDQLLHPGLDAKAEAAAVKAGHVLGSGLAASPGAAVGRLFFTAEAAEAAAAEEGGGAVILARTETSAEDVAGMYAAAGIITSRGGATSHAAVVARGWGRPCVCGIGAMSVDPATKTVTFSIGDGAATKTLKQGDVVSICGSSGTIYEGALPVVAPEVSGDLQTLLAWADAERKVGVRANADTPKDVETAVANGAEGVGLVRTEHMFFSSPERLAAMRRMIGAAEVATAPEDEADALAALRAFQAADFEGIFTAAQGRPVTIRLLDPPLHEFLPPDGSPQLAALIAELAHTLKLSPDLVARRLRAMLEQNPMLGFRGCRLSVVHPEIATMQVGAVIDAAVAVAKKGPAPTPHIMIPLVAFKEEFKACLDTVHAAARAALEAAGSPDIKYTVGTMIELPRAALKADELADAGAEFFSVGSNDLTQCTLGLSRDDAAVRFLPAYLKAGILGADPFQTVDKEGVGELIREAVQRGRAARPDLEIGVCGEHGGDPASIAFFAGVGIDYVSCSPLRVPVARLAAAQAAVRARGKDALAKCQD